MVFNFGLHDTSEPTPPPLLPRLEARPEANYMALLERYTDLVLHSGRVKRGLWASTTPFMAAGVWKTVEVMNRNASDLMRSRGVPVVDLFTPIVRHCAPSGVLPYEFCDICSGSTPGHPVAANSTPHYTDAGYQLLVDALVPAIKAALSHSGTGPAGPADKMLLVSSSTEEPPLEARLSYITSEQHLAVVEINQTSMPPIAEWFRIRPTPPLSNTLDRPCYPYSQCWFHRTAPKDAKRHQTPLGIQQLAFNVLGDARPGANITLIVEAWSDRTDLGDGSRASLLASSEPLTFTSDDHGFASQIHFGHFTAIENNIGTVTIRAKPANQTWYGMAKLITWFGYVLTGSSDGDTAAESDTSGSRLLPAFSIDPNALGDQYTTREFSPPEINVSYSQPGVHFLGIYSAWNGEYGVDGSCGSQNGWPRDLSTGKLFQPFAIITPWENGTVPSLPPAFDGPKLVTQPIPGDWRLALRSDRVTVFHGCVVYLRAVNGPKFPNGGQWAPEVVELDIPNGLQLMVPSTNCASDGGTGYNNASNVTIGHTGGGGVPVGYSRFRLNKYAKCEWSYINTDIELRFEVVNTSLRAVGGNFPRARIRAYTGVPNQQRSDNWQPLGITIKPMIPVAALPKRLHTSFCDTVSRPFVDDPARGLSSIATWKALGFNTVPGSGASYASPPIGDAPLIAPANRSGTEWAGMKYGIMTSPFGTSGLPAPPYGLGSLAALKMPLAAADSAGPSGFNFSAHGLTPAQDKLERSMWRNALLFYEANQTIDLSYDGWFKQHDFDVIKQLVNFTLPDYFSMDIEGFPELDQWIEVGFRSANFAAAKLPGETDSAASLRFAQSWIGGAAAAAKSVQPNAKAYLYDISAKYDAGFQITSWPMAATIGLADMPSYYGVENGLDVLARKVREERLAVGTGSELIPWLTPGATGGTGGIPGGTSAEPGVEMFNMLLQLFGNGATGFNVYGCIYDGSLWLGMRDAIALVTPYEDVIMDGSPTEPAVLSQVAASAVVSAIVDTGKGTGSHRMLIASSTIPYGRPTAFTVSAPFATSEWKLCDLITNRSVVVSATGVATWTAENEDGTMLLLALDTPCH